MPGVGGKEIGDSPITDFQGYWPGNLLRRRMSLPTLPTSQGDIVIPLPGQTTIDSRTKQLQEKANTRTPSGLVVDPVQLLQCVSGSDSAYNYNTVTSYSHTGHHAHTSSTSSSHKPIFSYPKPEAGHSQTDGSSQPTLPSPTDEAKEVEHFEVDPHARGVLTFRRNSMRQFSSIIEENENKEKSSYPPPTGGPQPGFITPLFVISDGIRRTYFPGAPNAKRRPESTQSQTIAENTDDSVEMYNKASSPGLLRKIQSHPELMSLGEMGEMDDGFDKSTRAFAKTSPRKIMQDVKSDKMAGSVSIFSNVAGELRTSVKSTGKPITGNQSKQVALPDKKHVAQSRQEVARTEHSPESSSPGTPDSAYVDLREEGKPKKKSFVKSIFQWGTESKVKMSDKESNIYSPTSF